MNLILEQSKNIYLYGKILKGLHKEFGYPFWHTMLDWCNVIQEPNDNNLYWQVYLIYDNGKLIGVCGLYSLKNIKRKDELWLGWFGLLPKLRNKGYGSEVLKILETKTKELGYKALMSYVDKNGKPLPFYQRNGFKIIGKVSEFIKKHKYTTLDDFEDPDDYVIYKKL